MNEITVLELNEELKKGDVNLIDVREYGEFANGRVKGAKNVPLGEVGKLHEELDTSEKVYVMCQTGRRSEQAQDILKAVGFNDVTNVRGGLDAWKNAGFPTEKDENAPWEIERQVRLAAGSLVLAGFFLGMVHWSFLFITAFVGAGLVISALTNTCTMGIILLKMPWNQRQKTVDSRQ
ncbi:MAG: rhodanese-like domain-containing protein [Aridibacter sp.]